MFEPGTLLYFTPFYFKNGNAAKDKYAVVIANCSNPDSCIILSLPTRRDNVPEKYEQETGCIEKPAISFNCYVIPAKEIVTECGFSFPIRTHLYGMNLDTYPTEMLESNYPLEGSDYEIVGKIIPELFQDLVDCFKRAKIVKRKIKKFF